MNQSENRKKHKTIRALESKAKNKDINALFQLAQYYEQGEYVEKDPEQAERYYVQALELFQPQSLQLSSLKLTDFRVFDHLEIDFCHQYKHNSNLTVIIGNNGAGKTTILEALAKSLSWLINSIRSNKDSGTGLSIDQLDINNNSIIGYSSIVCQFLITRETQYELELSKSKVGSDSSRKSSLENIKQLASIYKLAHSRNDQYNFPIMAFYDIERAIEIDKKDTLPFDEISEQKGWNKFAGYSKALNGSADFQLFFRWFKHLEDLNNATGQQNQSLLIAIDKLQAELDSELIKEMERQTTLDANIIEFLRVLKQQKQKKIAQLKAQITEESSAQPSTIIKHITEAIYQFMPGFSNLRIQRTPLAMLIDKDNVILNILQLSQGEKSLLALVADIARRLVLLNPSLDNPLQGKGIVLIDEIDLHLHPTWQQSVIPNLLSTFPNVQFIVTTHSPQVLTTVHHQCIRILTKGSVFNASANTFGEESRTTLEDVMSVDSRPQDLMSQQLTNYLERINRGDIESNDISSLRTELEKHYGKDYSQLRLADMAINRHLAIRKNKNI